MENETARDDIRKLLKTFGIQADEAIIRHLERLSGPKKLHLRLALEDRTEYGADAPEVPLTLTIDGDVRA